VPKTPKSLVNFLGPNSKLLEALPIATGKLNEYGKIKVPILVAIGDQQEYTALTIKDTLDLLKKENRLTEITQLKNCDHDFQGCEEQLANLVLSFIQKYAK
jgi:signal recognition particle receptor subunit beta